MHHLVAGYLQYKPRVHTPAQAVTDIDDLLPTMGSVPIRKVAALDTSAFDAALKESNHG